MKGPRTEEERSDTKGPRTEEERTDRRTNGVAVAKVEVSRGPFRMIRKRTSGHLGSCRVILEPSVSVEVSRGPFKIIPKRTSGHLGFRQPWRPPDV